MPIRDLADADLPEVQAIYAHHVINGTGTFEEDAPTLAEMRQRAASVAKRGGAFLVEEIAGRIAGYAYYAPLRDRSAYRFCVEDSIYVREDARGQGVGRRLLAALLARAEAAGIRQVVAVIGDSANAGSVALHEAAGFRRVGVWQACGRKHGRWLDAVHMQLAIGEGDRTAPD